MRGRDLGLLAAALDAPPELIGGTADGVPAHWNAVASEFSIDWTAYERLRAEFLTAEFRRLGLPYVAVACGAAEVGPGAPGIDRDPGPAPSRVP